MSSETKLTTNRVYELYERLIKDEAVDELELGLSVPNIFEVLKVSGKEIRHSNFLAWLLNPNGSHGLGDLFLKRFLRKLFASDKAKGLDPISVMEADLSKARVKREWKHIDLLIEMEDIVILVENKIYSSESKDQLSTYKKRVEKEYPSHKKVYAFLTPEGQEPEAEKKWYQVVSYQTIIDIIQKILSIYDQNLHTSAKVYLEDYQTILKRELMSGDKLSELAQRIYYNHRELMDFIIDNRPDEIDELKERLIHKIKEKDFKIGSPNKYYARFYTNKIAPFIYRGSESFGWKHRESFLFEIYIQPKILKVRFAISPADAHYDRDKVINILNKEEGVSHSKDKKWIHYFDKSFTFHADSLYTVEEKKVEKELDKIFKNNILPMVERVESAFEKNRKLLLNLNEEAERARE